MIEITIFANMGIHKEGYGTIGFSLVLLAVLNVMAFPFYQKFPFLIFVIGGLSVIFLIAVLQFFRVPKRQAAQNDNAIIAPADGKVVVIEEVEETEFLNERCIQVSIFMSPLDVHINWFPVSGKVVYSKYHPGKYLVAWHPKSSTDNERTTVVVKPENRPNILMRQIAGAVARRIICYATSGSEIKQCDQLGFIRFGSRVDIFLPLDAKIKVELNQKVTGSITTIAEFE